MSVSHLGAGEWCGVGQTECGLEDRDRRLEISYNLGRVTCEPCLMQLGERGIAAMGRLTEVIRSKT